MKIATYNMLKGGGKRVHWQRMIEDLGVDLLLMQETYGHDEHLPPLLYGQFTGKSVWSTAGNNSWGSGLFTRTGQLEPVPVPGFEGWVVGARLTGCMWQSLGQATLIFSIHAPNGEGRYRGQVNRILDVVGAIAVDEELVLGGDFNLTISSSAVPDRSVHKQDLAIQERLQNEFGLGNCWQTANPNQSLPQTLRWSGDRTIPYHCDGIFVPQSWLVHLRSCEVLSGKTWDLLSDHNPVIATFAESGLHLPSGGRSSRL